MDDDIQEDVVVYPDPCNCGMVPRCGTGSHHEKWSARLTVIKDEHTITLAFDSVLADVKEECIYHPAFATSW